MKGKWWPWAMVIALVLTACAKQHVPSEPKREQPPPVMLSPLTGTPISGGKRPLLMVMINNHHKARPQSGLQRADVVVEILAEGEITRFAAFYYNDLKGTVGPVRSVRSYYLDLAEGAHAVVVHAGGAPDALKRIREEHVPDLDGIHQDERYFTRVSFRRAPHNLYTSLENLTQAIEKKGEVPSIRGGYHFVDTPATQNGRAATKIHLVYHPLYEAGYQYDRATNSFIRYTEGVRQIDRETGHPLSMQNVLVVFAHHRVIDAVGHREVDVKGTGTGYLFQRGKAIPIEWKFRDGWIVPFKNGKEIDLIPGKTWVNILPETGKVSFR
ncbi:MAG: DUF3048 domain-containing protein [Thermoactinomyces sp.]